MDRLQIPWRAQMALAIAGYAAVFAAAATIILGRYLVELRNPNDFNGGMAAGGDLILDLFIGGLVLVPTFFFALVTREREAIFITFSKILFAFSLTAPISLGLMFIPAISQKNTILGTLSLYRLFGAPMIMTWPASARLLARFKPAKRLLSSALLIEFTTLVLFVVIPIFV
jgi:hypothetical protein